MPRVFAAARGHRLGPTPRGSWPARGVRGRRGSHDSIGRRDSPAYSPFDAGKPVVVLTPEGPRIAIPGVRMEARAGVRQSIHVAEVAYLTGTVGSVCPTRAHPANRRVCLES